MTLKCWNFRKAKRQNNGLHNAPESCHLFTGPTSKKQQNIKLELTVHKKCTIVLDYECTTIDTKTIYTLCMLCAAGCVAWWVGSRARPDPTHQTKQNNNTPHIYSTWGVLMSGLCGGPGWVTQTLEKCWPRCWCCGVPPTTRHRPGSCDSRILAVAASTNS